MRVLLADDEGTVVTSWDTDDDIDLMVDLATMFHQYGYIDEANKLWDDIQVMEVTEELDG
jgi:hypothetical protein